MKIIELLNKIANGEEVPEKIKFYGKYYIWYDNKYTGNEGYCLEPLKSDSNSFLEINTLYDLNKEVEILEENKIPEKLDWSKNDFTYPEGNLMSEETADMLMEIQDKVNFILDYLKSKGE